MDERKDVDDLVGKYKEKIAKEFGEDAPKRSEEKKELKVLSSREYTQFKRELLPNHLSWYEKACNISEKILQIPPNKKKATDLKEAIEICHLNVTPAGVTSFTMVGPLLFILAGLFISLLVLESTFFMVISLFTGLILMAAFGKLPYTFSNNWRLGASSQMVLCIFYVVTYMRHTSNIELAIDFAASHLSGPLSLDLKKVLWNVETERCESVKESLDAYLETWRKWNPEFIEAFHLIESSLFEPSETRRLTLLDKSLDVILDETYEKMLHYAQNLKSPITMLHMMGIILPILGLVILPMIVSFMEGIAWYHIATLYDVAIPLIVFYMGKQILASRPTGYGDTDISEENPELKKYKNIVINLGGVEMQLSPAYVAVAVGVGLFLFALSPVYLHAAGFEDFTFFADQFNFLGYKEDLATGETIGPYGMGAAIISVAMPLALALGVGLWCKLRSTNIIEIRKRAKELEKEFASALFQLGNRLGDGLPPEIAFGKVAESMQDTISGKFFQIASTNIQKMGMSVDDSIFHPKVGAISYFPSKIIDSSMKVLTESSRKGPKIAANAILNVARYIKEMHAVDERLKDLMSDIISSMKSQINFLTPVISGIVIGITSMVTSILGKLSDQMASISASGDPAAAGGIGGITSLFGNGIPTYYFQIIVGLYVVLIIIVLTILVNGIENGADKLNERFLLGRNLIKSTLIYAILSVGIMFAFNMIAASIMDATIGF